MRASFANLSTASVLLLVAAMSYSWWNSRWAVEGPIAPVFRAEAPPKPEPVHDLQAAPRPRSDVTDPSGNIRLPDGTYIPALNGVETAVLWGKRAFFPIVGRHVTDRGIEWYVHEDGSQSTTIRVQGTGPAATGIRSMILVARASDRVAPLRPGIPH